MVFSPDAVYILKVIENQPQIPTVIILDGNTSTLAEPLLRYIVGISGSNNLSALVTIDTVDFVPFELNEAKKSAAQILQSARLNNLSTCFGQTFIVRSSEFNELSEQLLNFMRKERKRYHENVLFKFPTESLELEQSDFSLDLTLIIDDLAQIAGQFKTDLVLNEHIKLINGTHQDIQYLSRRNLELRKQLEEVTMANLDNCEKMIDLRMEITNEKSDVNKKLLREIVIKFLFFPNFL